jgi:pantetheine-phosphate adenylyltransferase
MWRAALYAGSFDPVTNGHLDVVRQAARLADRLIIAVGVNSSKVPLFLVEERVAMLEEACGPLMHGSGCDLKITTFTDLVVAAARREGASLLIRGLRDRTHFDAEMRMAGMNEAMAPEMQIVYLPASPSVRSVTSTLVRQLASTGGNVAAFVPAVTLVHLKNKFGEAPWDQGH